MSPELTTEEHVKELTPEQLETIGRWMNHPWTIEVALDAETGLYESSVVELGVGSCGDTPEEADRSARGALYGIVVAYIGDVDDGEALLEQLVADQASS